VIVSLAQHVIALALVSLDLFVRAARMRFLMPVSLGEALVVNAYGDAVAMVTPARLGGDPARYVGFLRAGISHAAVIAGLGIEMILDWGGVLVGGSALTAAFASTGAAFVPRLVEMLLGPRFRGLLIVVLAALAVSTVALVVYRHRIPRGVSESVTEAWSQVRALPADVIGIVVALTFLSIAARTAVLPVLVAGVPDVSLGGSLLGSFTLIYSQQLLPTPGGAGAIEVGFIAGFAETMSSSAIAKLLVVWRFYSLFLGAGVGTWFFVMRMARRRRQPTSEAFP
jgi:uncharacterized membrane protein YbhN (UPF0104 family)